MNQQVVQRPHFLIARIVNRLTVALGCSPIAQPCSCSVSFCSVGTVNRAGIGLLLCMLAGCATTSTVVGEQLMAEKVSVDLVAKMKNLPGYGPRQLRSVQMLEQNSLFGQTLAQQLVAAGYQIDTVRERQGNRYLSFHIDSLQSESGASKSYTLAVGGLTLNREYRQDGREVYPVNYIEVSGVNDPAILPVAAQVNTSWHDASQPIDADSVVKQAQPKATANAAPVTKVLPMDLANLPRKNLYQTRKSNFAEFTGGYKAVRDTVLEFPNDSLRMSTEARQIIASMARLYHEESDLFSVIGCSHGKTALENGNELLALGRSRRVQQELIDLGVPVHKILDEGCWAPVHFDEMMPRRGVVLKLKRKI